MRTKCVGSHISTDDADRLHDIAVALETLRQMLGNDKDTDGISLLLDPLAKDLTKIDNRIGSGQ